MLLAVALRPDLDLSDIKFTVPIAPMPFDPRQIIKVADSAIRDYRDKILSELHHIGFAVKWEGGPLTLGRCYVLAKNRGLESKYFAASGPYQIDETARAYKRLVYLEDTQWGADTGVSELEQLINQPSTTEHGLQRFFRLHPEFLYQNGFIDYWAEPQLEDRSRKQIYKPDFRLKPATSFGGLASWRVVDLKRPNIPLFSSRRFHVTLSHYVNRVVTQLRDYSEYFDNPANQHDIELRFGSTILKPKLMAVIGRLPFQHELKDFAKLTSRMIDVSIVTYDEILEFRQYEIERRREMLR